MTEEKKEVVKSATAGEVSGLEETLKSEQPSRMPESVQYGSHSKPAPEVKDECPVKEDVKDLAEQEMIKSHIKLNEDRLAVMVQDLTLRFAEPALIGVLSSNVMKYKTLGEMKEERAKIASVALSIAKAMAEGVVS